MCALFARVQPSLGGSRCKNHSMPFGLRARGMLLPPWPQRSEAAVVRAAFSFAVWQINRGAAAYIFQGSPVITPAAWAMHSESQCLCSLCDAVGCRPTRAEVKTAPRGARTICLPLVFTTYCWFHFLWQTWKFPKYKSWWEPLEYNIGPLFLRMLLRRSNIFLTSGARLQLTHGFPQDGICIWRPENKTQKIFFRMALKVCPHSTTLILCPAYCTHTGLPQVAFVSYVFVWNRSKPTLIRRGCSPISVKCDWC